MLRTNPSFLSFIENLRLEVDSGVTLKAYPAGTPLLQQGAKASRVFIVRSGIAKCYFSEENGKDYILEFLGEGEIAGELEVIKGMNCLCSVEAVTDVEAYALSLDFFRSLLEKNLVFNQLLLDELAERIVNTSSRASVQQLYTLEHGLSKILEFQRRQQIILPKEDIAAYLRVTLRSLNRALKKFGSMD